MDSEVDAVGGSVEGTRRARRQVKATVGEEGGLAGPVEKVGLEADGDRHAQANETRLALRGGHARQAAASAVVEEGGSEACLAAEEGPL